MAQPTINSIQAVDPVLTNMLLAYMQGDDRFVADRVFPSVPVGNITDTYYILTKKYWFTDEAKKRAPGSAVPRGGYGVETATLETIQYALGHEIPRENRANNQVPMSLERVGVQWLAGRQLLRRELLFATAAFTGANWSNTGTPTNKWSDYAASDPVADIKTAKRTISQSTGFSPNMMVMGEIVDDRLQNHPDLIDRIKYTTAATEANIRNALASIFELQYVVGKAIYNTANESQTASFSPIIDDDCLITYTQPGADMLSASGGKTFFWAPGGGLGTIEPMWFSNETKSDVIDSFQQITHKVTAADLGYLYTDAVD